MKNKFRQLATSVAVVFAMGAGNAMAVPVDQLYFSQSAQFTSATINPLAGMTINMTANQLDWGGGAARSYLNLNTYNDTTSVFPTDTSLSLGTFTNGQWNANEWAVISNLHQTNNVITGNDVSPTWTADISAYFAIFSDAARTTEVKPGPMTVETFYFHETLNRAPCSTNITGSTPCEDLYWTLASVFDNEYFSIGDQQYVVEYLLMGGPGTFATLNGDFIEVYAAEQATSDIYITARWNAVPEPGSMALMGLGLMGLAALRRRKIY